MPNGKQPFIQDCWSKETEKPNVEFKVNKPEFKSIDTNRYRCCYEVTQYFIEKRQTIAAIKKQTT